MCVLDLKAFEFVVDCVVVIVGGARRKSDRSEDTSPALTINPIQSAFSHDGLWMSHTHLDAPIPNVR